MLEPPSIKISDDARAIWLAGVAVVDAKILVRNFVSVNQTEIKFGEMAISHADYQRIIVVGGGKASGWMAAGLEEALGDEHLKNKHATGLINVPDDQVVTLNRVQVVGCRPAGINLPTERVIESTEKIVELVSNCQPDDLVIVLIAGGGSALLELPIAPVTLADLQTVTQLLSHRGATIDELNCVRQRISHIKSGGLARLANCRRMITLVVSDVLGDPLNIIASGPTVSTRSTTDTSATLRQNAMDVLQRFDPELKNVPASVLQILTADITSRNLEKAQTSVDHFIIGNNELAVAAAKSKAIELGYACESETNGSSETAEQAATRLSQRLLASAHQHPSSKRCFISGGEPTVKLCSQPGSGGRNQQLVLAALLELLQSDPSDGRQFAFLSGGTDGEDGNVPVAGAYFDWQIIQKIRTLNLTDEIAEHLGQNDSYPLLGRLNCILKTPPTRTNVCDLRIVLHSNAEN